MTAERWQRAMAIFRGAVESDPAARDGFLKQSCGDDEELRKEVEALLASNQDPGAPADPPIAGASAASSPNPNREMSQGAPATLGLNDRYEVERELGRGGMSVVYLARDRQLLEKKVVIKVLLDESSQDPWIRQKFQQELEALARIDHPGIVGILDTGFTDKGRQFLVMQYVAGTTLRRAMVAGGMSFARVAAIIRAIGEGLQAAHDQGVWHRDLKPENIMLQQLGREEHVKLIDFGIAGIRNSQFSGEQTKIAGTVHYMAPEQFAGQSGPATDTYALAVVAWELLTGKAPFPEGSMVHLVAEDTGRRTRLRQSLPDLPVAAELSIAKAMSFRPEQRQGSVVEFSEELSAALTAGGPVRKTPVLGTLEIAHVLFTDLVGYSVLPMDRQKQYVDELQEIVRLSPQFCATQAEGNLISLPTGDGMALAFFGDPTAPAQCALELAAELRSRPHLKLRMGVHSGPVYRVADVNANANVAGGGINIAQRVMDCGDAGHILLSKGSAEVLLQLSQWAPYLTDLGECQVKHGVTVHLYNLASAEFGNPAIPRKVAARPAAKTRPKVPAVITWLAAATAAAVGIWFVYSARNGQFGSEASLAVLPFADMTPEKNQEYFSDGLAEELINGLAKTPGLRVAGRTSCFQFKGKSENSREVGKKLNVSTILEGSVRKQGSRVRIAVELVRAKDDSNIWSQSFDREMNDIFAVEDEIAEAVTQELRPKLIQKKGAVRAAKSTTGDAYNAYLQGQYFLRLRNKENLEKSVGYFQEAVRLDPAYGPAWVGLSKSFYSQADSGYAPLDSSYQNARQAANRALGLDPNNGEAYAAIAWILMHYDWKWEDANAALKKALTLEPGNAPALGAASTLDWMEGRTEEAIAISRRVVEIDPLHAVAFRNLGLQLYSAGREVEAENALKRSIELAPELAMAHSILALVRLAQQRPEAALDEAGKERDPEFRLQAQALAYHALGRTKESDAGLAELIKGFSDDPYVIAETYAFRGQTDLAFEWLDRAYRERDTGIIELKVDPLLNNLTHDSRFARLLEKLRLVDGKSQK